METQVRTPQMVFMQPQRLVVPLFQRPYVWNEENQWEPLWNDVVRVTDRVLNGPLEKHHPHFLGAVVLQQVQKQTGQMQERTIIDGQQRLTTLQLLLDALHAELQAVQALQPAMRIEPLVTNAEPFCSKPEDRFKVWPTNRDRPAFNALWALSLLSITTWLATAENGWWRRIASSASKHVSGSQSTSRSGSRTSGSDRDGSARTPTDGRDRPRSRRECSRDLRDFECSWCTAHGSGSYQELRIPAIARNRHERRGCLPKQLEGI
jgi:Protein of unknown function DUF262